MNTLLEYLKKYNTSVSLVDSNSLHNIKGSIPSYWYNALSQNSIEEKVRVILGQWSLYTEQFANVIEYLTFNLVDVSLVRMNDVSYSLIYSIKNLEGNIIYYEGKNPSIKTIPKELEELWQRVPDHIKTIYDELHNGWVYYSSQSNGVLPIEDVLILGNNEWGILEEIEEDSLPFNLSHCVGFFHNGMGDYVAIDLGNKNDKEGFIWWNRKAPKLNIEFWPVVDEWTRISIER